MIYFRIRVEVHIKTKMTDDSLNLFIQSIAEIPADIALIQLNQYLGKLTEENKKSPAFWNGVQKTAMKLLADNLQKYAGMVKK